MGRIRTIKPEYPQSESVGRLSRDARLLHILLWTKADDEGRLRGNSRMLASTLYPYDRDAFDLMDGWLVELERESMVTRYLSEGSAYIQIHNWLKHQRIDKPSKSNLPEFVEDSAKPRGGFAVGKEGNGMEGRGKDLSARRAPSERVPDAAEVERVYRCYPRHVGKGPALAAIARAVVHLGTGKDWPKLSQQEALEFLCQRATLFAESDAGKAGQYTPHPATWFEQRRYLDDEREWRRGDGERGATGGDAGKPAGAGSAGRTSAAAQRRAGSLDAIRRAAERARGADGADAGGVSQR